MVMHFYQFLFSKERAQVTCEPNMVGSQIRECIAYKLLQAIIQTKDQHDKNTITTSVFAVIRVQCDKCHIDVAQDVIFVCMVH